MPIGVKTRAGPFQTLFFIVFRNKSPAAAGGRERWEETEKENRGPQRYPAGTECVPSFQELPEASSFAQIHPALSGVGSIPGKPLSLSASPQETAGSSSWAEEGWNEETFHKG